jgi:hypothetical protein
MLRDISDLSAHPDAYADELRRHPFRTGTAR